jgi:hypothetical protein
MSLSESFVEHTSSEGNVKISGYTQYFISLELGIMVWTKLESLPQTPKIDAHI